MKIRLPAEQAPPLTTDEVGVRRFELREDVAKPKRGVLVERRLGDAGWVRGLVAKKIHLELPGCLHAVPQRLRQTKAEPRVARAELRLAVVARVGVRTRDRTVLRLLVEPLRGVVDAVELDEAVERELGLAVDDGWCR